MVHLRGEASFQTVYPISDISMLRYSTPAMISEETLCECMGMQNLLSSEMTDLLMKKRQAYSKAILLVQRNYRGNDMIDMLAKMSKKSS